MNLIEADGGNEQPGGRSEQIVGAAVADQRSHWTIASKSHSQDCDGCAADIQKSLTTLATDYIHIYQIHQLDEHGVFAYVMSDRGAFAALSEARQSERVRAIGLTSHSEELLLKAAESGRFDVLTFPYGAYSTRAEKDLLPMCRRSGVATIAIKRLGGSFFSTALGAVWPNSRVAASELVGYTIGEQGADAALVGLCPSLIKMTSPQRTKSSGRR